MTNIVEPDGVGEELFGFKFCPSGGKFHLHGSDEKLTKNVKRAIQAVDWPDWKGSPTEGMQQVAELSIKLTGWSQHHRVIVSRTLKPLVSGPQENFWGLSEKIDHAYVTNLTLHTHTSTQQKAPRQSPEGFKILR